MDKQCNLAIARNIAPCIRALIPVNDKRENLLKQLEEKGTMYVSSLATTSFASANSKKRVHIEASMMHIFILFLKRIFFNLFIFERQKEYIIGHFNICACANVR